MSLPLSRRDLLCNTAAGCAAVATASLMPGCGFDVSFAPEVSVELIQVATDPRYGQIKVPLNQGTRMDVQGTAIILSFAAPAGLPFTVPEGGVLLVHRGPGSDAEDYAAVAALCSHKACPLGYSVKDQQIACPCHGSRFVADSADPSGRCIGDVTRGPAKAALSAYKVELDKTNPAQPVLYVDLRTPPTCSGVFVPTVTSGQVVLPFNMVPELAQVGGSWTGAPAGLGDTLIVVRVTQTTASALSAICTHQGCSVAFAPATQNLICPCHDSRFDLNGAVTQAPAPRPLKKYTAAVDAQSVTITVS